MTGQVIVAGGATDKGKVRAAPAAGRRFSRTMAYNREKRFVSTGAAAIGFVVGSNGGPPPASSTFNRDHHASPRWLQSP